MNTRNANEHEKHQSLKSPRPSRRLSHACLLDKNPQPPGRGRVSGYAPCGFHRLFACSCSSHSFALCSLVCSLMPRCARAGLSCLLRLFFLIADVGIRPRCLLVFFFDKPMICVLRACFLVSAHSLRSAC